MTQQPHTIAARYQIDELIGQGGMGEVYRGADTQTGQTVAIKVLKSDIVAEDAALVERFAREGEALRRLNHPNIVKVLAMVEEDGRHYIIMEYVGGGDLRRLLQDRGKLPTGRTLEIALDLADALTRAHRLKIVHRDIKPANVLLAEDGTPRLTDFGVAQMGDRTRITQAGSMVGTVAYLSPEVCNGETPDARADIWSFGVMLYEMLAGRRPFEEDQPAAMIMSIATKPMPDLRAYCPGVPPRLADLIEKMLEKDRGRRTGSVRRVGLELESAIAELDTPTRAEVLSTTGHGTSRFATPTPAETATFAEAAGDVPAETPFEAPAQPAAETRAPAKRSKLTLALFGVLALAILAAVAAATISIIRNQLSDDAETVEPVGPREYMVLVAQAERLSGDRRDVTRFIIDDLVQTLEVGALFSDVRVREYPKVVTSAEQALEAAEANDAPVVIWGHYTDDKVQLEVQVGSLAQFPYNQMSRDMLERTANVRVEMADERRQSVAPQALGVLAALQNADGDGFGMFTTIAVLDEINVESADVVGGGVAAHVHRFFQVYFSDIDSAFDEIEAALTLDAGNPLLYISRGMIAARQNNAQGLEQDIQTAKRLGPDDWAFPYLMDGAAATIQLDVDGTIEGYSRAAELRPDDWFLHLAIGLFRHMNNELEAAQAAYDHAIELGPKANFPYLFSAMLAMHEGRLTDAIEMMDIVLTEYPDPTFMSRIMSALLGDTVYLSMGVTAEAGAAPFAAFANLALGRYDEVIQDVEAGLDAYKSLAEEMSSGLDAKPIGSAFLSDLYLAQGFAYCNLGDNATAEAAYTNGLDMDPDHVLLYLLRAEVRIKQGDTTGALKDLAAARDKGDEQLDDAINAFMNTPENLALGCENLLDQFAAPAP